MRRLCAAIAAITLLALALAPGLGAQTRVVSVSPDTLTLTVGDTARLRGAVRAGTGAPLAGAELSYAGTNSTAFTVHRDGKITARAPGCGLAYVRHAANAAAQVAICVVAATAPSPAPTPAPTPSSGAVPVFESRWSTALGQDAAAITDGGRWTVWNNYAGAHLLSVVPTDTLGFPTRHVLRVRYDGENAGDVRVVGAWPVPQAAGEGLWYRIYLRYALPDGFGPQSQNATHPLQPWSGTCPAAWSWKPGYASNGTFPLQFFLGGSADPWFQLQVPLAKYRTYRLEWGFVRKATAGPYRADVRIYDARDSLIATAADFRNDSRRALGVVDPDVTIPDDCAGRLFVGNNGPGWSITGQSFLYYGAVAVCRTGWCGPARPD